MKTERRRDSTHDLTGETERRRYSTQTSPVIVRGIRPETGRIRLTITKTERRRDSTHDLTGDREGNPARNRPHPPHDHQDRAAAGQHARPHR
jgi:hypothetical protein